MTSYIVLNPPGKGDASGQDNKVEDAMFIRDGFSWLAFLLPPLFLIIHRLWIEAGILLLGLMLSGLVAVLTGFTILPDLLWLGAALYLGLEGQAVRVRALVDRGWQIVDVAVADNLGDAEAVWFGDATGDMPSSASAQGSKAVLRSGTSGDQRSQGAALGLMNPYGGR